MAVDDFKVIDSISEKEGKIFLTISDHLKWDKYKKHFSILEDKINAYLDVVKSGQIYNVYPLAVGKTFSILLFLKYQPNTDAVNFLENIKKNLDKNGFGFDYKHLK